NDQLVNEITYATNSQNPVDLRDLRSNDELQIRLETGISQLGYEYKRYRDNAPAAANVLTSAITAVAVMATWRKAPHQSKFQRKELFGKLYNKVFDGLNAAQAILAVQIFRLVENERKRPRIIQPSPEFLPYAGHYLAMLVSEKLLRAQKIEVAEI